MNPAYLLILHVLDLLTGGSLDYETPHGKDQSRIEAALRLVDSDAVRRTEAPGVYLVKSDDRTKPGKSYYVTAEWGSLDCPCEDATVSDHNPVKICKHILAAVVMEAQLMTFAQMEAQERAQRSAA